MRVIVGGGSGTIGRALVGSLAGDGHEVVVLSRSPDRVTGLPPGARAVGWDAEGRGDWWGEVDGADAVVHLAGANIAGGPWTEGRRRLLRDSRVVSSRAIADAVLGVGSPPEVLVQASAVGYYGDGGDEVKTETDPPGEGFLADLSVEWEAASAPVEAEGIRRPILRTSLVLAADEGILPVMAIPFRLFVGGRVGRGDQWVPWIHLADEVAAIRFLLDHRETSGPFNLAAPEPVTNRELSRTVARVLRRPCWATVPAFVLRLLLGEMSSLLLEGQRAVPERLEGLGFEFRFPILEEALEDLLG